MHRSKAIFYTGLGGSIFTLRHCNGARAVEQKSLCLVVDTKSNPVCAVYRKKPSVNSQKILYAASCIKSAIFDVHVLETLLCFVRFHNAFMPTIYGPSTILQFLQKPKQDLPADNFIKLDETDSEYTRHKILVIFRLYYKVIEIKSKYHQNFVSCLFK